MIPDGLLALLTVFLELLIGEVRAILFFLGWGPTPA